MEIAELVHDLNGKLGPQLVAAMTSTGEDMPRRWERGLEMPSSENVYRLDTARRAWRYITMGGKSGNTAWIWFTEPNPNLDQMTPIQAIREKRYEDVMMASNMLEDSPVAG